MLQIPHDIGHGKHPEHSGDIMAFETNTAVTVVLTTGCNGETIKLCVYKFEENNLIIW